MVIPRSILEMRLLGGNPILFLFFAFCSCLVINNSSSHLLDVVLCFKAYGDSCVDPAENQKLLRLVN